MGRFIPNEHIENRPGARLPVVQFQKEKYPRNQLTEIYQIRVEPVKVRYKGRTLREQVTLYDWRQVIGPNRRQNYLLYLFDVHTDLQE